MQNYDYKTPGKYRFTIADTSMGVGDEFSGVGEVACG